MAPGQRSGKGCYSTFEFGGTYIDSLLDCWCLMLVLEREEWRRDVGVQERRGGVEKKKRRENGGEVQDWFVCAGMVKIPRHFRAPPKKTFCRKQ